MRVGWLTRVSVSKNKNVDHRVTETSAIISTRVTYEIDHFAFNKVICTRFLYFMYFIVIMLHEMYIVKKEMLICEISIIIFIILIYRKLGSVRPVQQKIELPSATGSSNFF